MSVLVGALGAVLLAAAALLQVRLIAQIGFDGENSPTESETLYALQRVRAGEPLYLDYSRPPHVLTPYMPLFYVGPGWVCRLTDGEWMTVAAWGRAMVYAFWLGIGAMIYAVARQLSCGRGAAAIGALLWLGSQVGTEWSNSFRPDAVTLFLSLAALWVYQRDERPARLAVVWGLLTLALLHKHSVAAPLLVIALEEWSRRRWRVAAMLLGGWAAVVVAMMVIGQAVTHGRFAMNVGMAYLDFARWQYPLRLFVVAMVLGAVGFSGGTLACVKVPAMPGVRLWKRYFVLALAVGGGSTVLYGAAINHYMEPLAAACVLTALLVQCWQSSDAVGVARWGRVAWLGGAAGLSLSILVHRCGEFPMWARDLIEARTLRAEDAPQWNKLLQAVGESAGRVLSEDPYLAVRATRRPLIIDVSKFAHLHQSGVFDESRLLEMIRAGTFDVIVTQYPVEQVVRTRPMTRRWLDAMQGRYRLGESYSLNRHNIICYIYRPVTTP